MLLDLRSLEEVTAPAPTAAVNYYSGGFANGQRLTRGLGWVTAWLLVLLQGW